jgi:hypothetical protein
MKMIPLPASSDFHHAICFALYSHRKTHEVNQYYYHCLGHYMTKANNFF